MSKENFVQRFKGEISAQDELAMNAEGGSITATLKRRLAMALGMADVPIAAGVPPKPASSRPAVATVEIDSANRLVLMTTQGIDEPLNLSRSPHRQAQH